MYPCFKHLCLPNVSFWPKADILIPWTNVRFPDPVDECPLSGVMRTSKFKSVTSLETHKRHKALSKNFTGVGAWSVGSSPGLLFLRCGIEPANHRGVGYIPQSEMRISFRGISADIVCALTGRKITVRIIGQARHRAPPFLPSVGINIFVGEALSITLSPLCASRSK